MSPWAVCCPCLWLEKEGRSALLALPGHLQPHGIRPPLPGQLRAALQVRHL